MHLIDVLVALDIYLCPLVLKWDTLSEHHSRESGGKKADFVIC